MRLPSLPTTLTYLAGVAALSFLILARLILANDIPSGLFATGVAGLMGLGWLIYRTSQKARLPHTGLNWVWLLGLAAAALSTVFSPNPRMAIERLPGLAAGLLLFYLLLDGLESGLDRRALVDALLAISGLLAVMAGMEATAFYSGWWQVTGGQAPPFPYRLATLIGHPNVYIAFMNLCAPFGLVSFLTARTKTRRFFSLSFLVFYAFSIPFASSRGGLLGLVVWGSCMVLAWANLKGWWRPLWVWIRRRWLLAVLAVAGGLALLSVGALRVNQIFQANPSHGGGGLLGDRPGIWGTALAVWQSHPWTGVGPGRFTQGWLEADRSIPPDFWAAHAHNFLLQALAEMGPLGLISLLVLLVCGYWRLWSAWKHTPPEIRPWSAAALAGLTGLLAHSIIDDFSTSPPILAALILSAALVWIGGEKPLQRNSRISLGWLILPLSLVCLTEVWSQWAALPAFQALDAAKNGRWQAAARDFNASTLRDPAYEFYHFQEGLAWDQVWRRSADPADLDRARASIRAALKYEPGFSLLWADLAALDQQAGQSEQAFAEINEAIRRAPSELKYKLFRAFLLEQDGRAKEAAQAYSETLIQAPDWVSHPFLAGSALRQQAIQDLPKPNSPSIAYWQQAEQAMKDGHLAEARRLLAFSDIVSEPPEARAVMHALLDESSSGMQAALPAYLALRDLLDAPILSPTTIPVVYNGYHNRAGLPNQLVSGFVNLSGDYGQFLAMQKLYNYEHENGECSQAGQTWIVWHEAQQGYASPKTPPSPNCP